MHETRSRSAVAVLALVTFTAALVENAPAAVLPSLAERIGVSTGEASFSVSAFAAAAAVTSIPLAHASRRWSRRRLIVTAGMVLLVATLGAGVTADPIVHVACRAVAGIAAGVVWSIVGGYAHRIAPVGQETAYLATALFGGTLSAAFGIPLVATLGSWASTSVILCGLVGGMTVLAWLLLPDTRHGHPPVPPAADGVGRRRLPTLLLAGIMALGALGYSATATFLTVIVPVGSAPLAFGVLGVASFAGGIVAIVALQREPRSSAVAMLALMLAGLLLLSASSTVTPVIVAACALWGLGWGPLAAAMQAAATRSSTTPDIANAAQLTGYNIGLAAGPATTALVTANSEAPAALVSVAATTLALAVLLATLRLPELRGRRPGTAASEQR